MLVDMRALLLIASDLSSLSGHVRSRLVALYQSLAAIRPPACRTASTAANLLDGVSRTERLAVELPFPDASSPPQRCSVTWASQQLSAGFSSPGLRLAEHTLQLGEQMADRRTPAFLSAATKYHSATRNLQRILGRSELSSLAAPSISSRSPTLVPSATFPASHRRLFPPNIYPATQRRHIRQSHHIWTQPKGNT